MLPREAAKDQPGRDKIGGGLGRWGHSSHGRPKQVEGPEPKSHHFYSKDHVLPFGYWLQQKEWVPVIHIGPERTEEFEALAAARGVPCARIGETGGPRMMFAPHVETTVDEAGAVYEESIPKLMAG